MADTPSYQQLVERVEYLEAEANQHKRLKAINTALYRISEAVNAATSLNELYGKIHQALSPVVDTTNFYISLYEPSDDSITFPYIVDSVDFCYPSVINVSGTASSTAEVIRLQTPLLIQKAEILERRAKSDLILPICTPAEAWLGVPLKTPRSTIGVMVVQSYTDPECYDHTDMTVLVSVADMVAVAIERKQVENALRLSEERYRRIITTVREGIVILDTDNRITYANAHLSEMLGYPPAELTGLSFESLLFEEDRQNFRARQDERKQGKNEQFERRFRSSNGEERWAIVSASPVTDGKGNYAGALSSITDISDRKQAETALREKNRELENAMRQIKTLRGIVPICMGCKKIRDDNGYWNQVEVYVRKHTEAEFSHGLCPECMEKMYPEYVEEGGEGDIL